jgi:hypothetical protein
MRLASPPPPPPSSGSDRPPASCPTPARPAPARPRGSRPRALRLPFARLPFARLPFAWLPLARLPAVLVAVALLAAGTAGCGGGERADLSRWSGDQAPHAGAWQLVRSESSAIDPWNRLALSIEGGRDRVTLVRTWTGSYGVTATDSIAIPVDGARHEVAVPQWPDNRHIAVAPTADSVKHVAARWLDRGRTLQVDTDLPVRTSQGPTEIRVHTEYRIAPDGEELTVLELRSSRPRPIQYTFVPAE